MPHLHFQKILLLDNFDSFTYNLVDFFKITGCQVVVVRNNVPLKEIQQQDFDLLVLSPGPSIPKNSGNLLRVIEYFATRKPIFGVCLGLEALVEFFGGQLQFVMPMHGKSSVIAHDGQTIFKNLPPNFLAGRYHSLATKQVPKCFQVSATLSDQQQAPEIPASAGMTVGAGMPNVTNNQKPTTNNQTLTMALRHRELPIEAVQFHPESVLTMSGECGQKMIQNVVTEEFGPQN